MVTLPWSSPVRQPLHSVVAGLDFIAEFWPVLALDLRPARVSGSFLSVCLAYIFGRFWSLIPPKIFEPAGRKLRVAHGVLDGSVPEVRLQRAGIDAIVRELETAGMPQHVRV